MNTEIIHTDNFVKSTDGPLEAAKEEKMTRYHYVSFNRNC